MDGAGLRHRGDGSEGVRFSTDATDVDWFKDRPRDSMLKLGQVLPETVTAQLPGRKLSDLVEMPDVADERIAKAVSGLEIASVTVISKETWVRLRPTRWIEATALPPGADPACLAVPIPDR